ncbi:MAG: membrane-bound lytic murein transglycosylase MltF [Marinobacter sp.]|nr:membrane-bound lytic murein transglycosylase MltF [Marinobacter sp.]
MTKEYAHRNRAYLADTAATEIRDLSRFFNHLSAFPAHFVFLLGATLALTGCSRPSTVQEIQNEGVLHVITRVAPSMYFEGREGVTGYDYELAKRFADEIGVELKVRVADDNTEILSVLERNFAHIGMAGVSRQPDFKDRYEAVPTGIQAQSVVVYHRDMEAPESLESLAGQTLHLVADSDHEHLLETSASETDISWQVHPGLDAPGVLARVESGEFPFAVVSSNELELNHVFYPHVKEAFGLGEPRELVWLFPKEQDGTLAQTARQFLQRLQGDGVLAQLSERFYGHLDRLNYVGARTFMHHVENRLPKYEKLFREYARDFNMDWRLLAAIGYQESHWRPNAVSPTGVRGLMMLTRNTASYVGINNRLDAEESIHGGAKYFQMVHDKIPERIPEPDRTWFALASYNVGFGHLEDARRLTESAGKDPDRWMDVKEFLPLLAQKEFYTKTRYGFARGQEPVIYVQNIRRYYDVLARVITPAPPTKPEQPQIVGIEPEAGPDSGTSAEEPTAATLRASLPKDLSLIPPTL